MSNHKTPVTEIEREGLIAHGLGRYIGKPSQLADVFRQGVAWALKAAPATAPEPAWHDAPTEPGLWVQRSNLGSALEYVRHEDMGAQNWRGRWFGPIPQDKEGGEA